MLKKSFPAYRPKAVMFLSFSERVVGCGQVVGIAYSTSGISLTSASASGPDVVGEVQIPVALTRCSIARKSRLPFSLNLSTLISSLTHRYIRIVQAKPLDKPIRLMRKQLL